jgi:hypothetical protein
LRFFLSFESLFSIKLIKATYYQALKNSSVDWHESRNSYFPFIENFITTLLYCYKELDKRFAVVNSKKVTKRRHIESTVLNSLLPISKAVICYILPDVSPTTVEAVLPEMIKTGQIKKLVLQEALNTLKRRKFFLDIHSICSDFSALKSYPKAIFLRFIEYYTKIIRTTYRFNTHKT